MENAGGEVAHALCHCTATSCSSPKVSEQPAPDNGGAAADAFAHISSNTNAAVAAGLDAASATSASVVGSGWER